MFRHSLLNIVNLDFIFKYYNIFQGYSFENFVVYNSFGIFEHNSYIHLSKLRSCLVEILDSITINWWSIFADEFNDRINQDKEKEILF